MAVAGSGVTQPEAALEARELLAGCRCRCLSPGRMRARQRDRGRPRYPGARRPRGRSAAGAHPCRIGEPDCRRSHPWPSARPPLDQLAAPPSPKDSPGCWSREGRSDSPDVGGSVLQTERSPDLVTFESADRLRRSRPTAARTTNLASRRRCRRLPGRVPAVGFSSTCSPSSTDG
jgi:hypothetical protein